ncbi:MAG: carboxypeptidase M32 [Ferruginibacter sp.]
MHTSALYETYKTKMQKIADVKYASAVLQWDQETYLPTNGSEKRGCQIATLLEFAHEMFVSDEMGGLLQELVAREGLTASQKQNVLLSWQDFERSKKFSAAFVRNMSETVNKSFHAWVEARKKNSFAIFSDRLQAVIDLKKQEADLIGYAAHPYDALMNDYDKGLTVAKTDDLFAGLMPTLNSLLQEIKGYPQVNDAFLFQQFDKDKQWQVGIEILKEIGFDFESGRQDISEHPFTTNFSSQDVRVTTRIDETNLSTMLWSCIHEGGHALYEQGLPASEYGLPLGEYCSLSIHESQSRLWENCMGRGLPFWEKYYSLLVRSFPKQLADVSLENFYKGINKVTPSLIRTEADELTYHFHVWIRYQIEKLLIEGTLTAREIPGVWNELYLKYLEIKVPDNKNGCLQDVHWSHGSFGYFATYTIGSLYAAQFYETIEKQTHQSHLILSKTGTKPVLKWLKQHIFPFGRYYQSNDLCAKATGSSLNSNYFLSYATQKFKTVYETI